MYSLRLAAWGPSGESQKPVEAADATVATPKLPPQVCSIVPRTRHGPEKSNVPCPAEALSVLWLEGPALEFFPALPIRSCGTRGSLNQEVGEAKIKAADHHAAALMCVLCSLLSLTLQSLPMVALCSPSRVCHCNQWEKLGGNVLTASSHDLNPPTGVRSHPSWSFSTPVFQGPPKLWPLPQL